MALETADLNDATILEQTKQENDGKGNIRFKITLPDGHVIHSEWINPDNRRKAIFAWVEVVKQTAAARSVERENEIKAQIRRQRDEEQAKKGLIELPPGIIRQTEAPPERESEEARDAPLATQRMAVADSGAVATLLHEAQKLEKQARALRFAAELLQRNPV